MASAGVVASVGVAAVASVEVAAVALVVAVVLQQLALEISVHQHSSWLENRK